MIPAGYLYKKVVTAPEWVRHPGSIYSMSGCLSEHFADYIRYWRHNGWWLFDSPEIIEALAVENGVDLSGQTLFYYELFERQFEEAERRWIGFEPEPSFPTNVQSPASARLEGYDVVTFVCQNSPECSPLSCCALAAAAGVNQHCLFDSFERAKRALEEGVFDDSEPGPFRIVAVSTVARPGS